MSTRSVWEGRAKARRTPVVSVPAAAAGRPLQTACGRVDDSLVGAQIVLAGKICGAMSALVRVRLGPVIVKGSTHTRRKNRWLAMSEWVTCLSGSAPQNHAAS